MSIPLRISSSGWLSLGLVAVACGSSSEPPPPPRGAPAPTGEVGTTVGCTQATTMLDVSKSPGAGAGYAAPTLSATCTSTSFVVEGNGMPTYTFVKMTPNPLVAQTHHYEIPRYPTVAPKTTDVPLLGTVGFAVNGMPFFGPNEGAVPAEEAYGDPVFNGLMDPCLGHTANEYHYHSMDVKCLVDGGLVAEPWTQADPAADKPSPLIGYALDGFPVLGPFECADASCTTVHEMKSGYAKTGNPKTNAWMAYTWEPHAEDASYLDACNGHMGSSGDYHYHATSGFPYVIGCYLGTPNGAGQQATQGGGNGMGGPKSCAAASDCAGACPPGSSGCTCSSSPMGQICVPTCAVSTDCPTGPMGALTCHAGICVPG